MSRLIVRLRCLRLAWFSHPRGSRVLYRHLGRRRPTRLLELGIGNGQRARQLIELASALSPGQTVRYTGIDQFEARSAVDGAGMSLRLAHRSFVGAPAKVRLVPGDPYAALARTANALGTFDLLLVAADQQRESLADAWFYVPRLLAEGAAVFLEERTGADSQWRIVSETELRTLSTPPPRRRAA
ncbi:MAG TPA: hypothetical protein VG713_16990 [Pirellulales bacterium]|nr:hypothetical protein [Pirellulales bacterium]